MVDEGKRGREFDSIWTRALKHRAEGDGEGAWGEE
jgi:hypothetical protein